VTQLDLLVDQGRREIARANDQIERALTLTQPWAGLVASGIKRIENRPWKPAEHMIGRRFAIHASRECDLTTVEKLISMGIDDDPDWHVLGAIVGVARVTGYVRSVDDLVGTDQERFWMGPFAFLLSDIQRLETPVECKGALGFWGLSESLAMRVTEQLAVAA
jgi:hypothetical protein